MDITDIVVDVSIMTYKKAPASGAFAVIRD
jgi:hypothetical protein